MGERVEGKVAVVTGAGSSGPGWGNGKAAAVLYAREGARVMCLDVRREAAEETAAIIRGEGGVAEARVVDVARSDEVAAAIAQTLTAFGRLDILHNNVGIVALGGPVELDETEWDRVTEVNLKSVYLTCRHALPVMERQGRGAIVNISSIAGIRHTGVDYIAYSTTKGAIIPFTRAIALHYARKGIRANCILPGLMNTPMIRTGLPSVYAQGDVERMVAVRDAQCPMGHMGDAWDVAYAALFLASDEAKYVTGAELVVDGGITCKYA